MGDWYRKIPDWYMSVEKKLESMDSAGITMTAISINDPGPEWFGTRGPEVIVFCHSLFGAERLLYSSDHPWVDPSVILSALEKTGLTAADQELIRHLNAKALFGL